LDVSKRKMSHEVSIVMIDCDFQIVHHKLKPDVYENTFLVSCGSVHRLNDF